MNQLNFLFFVEDTFCIVLVMDEFLISKKLDYLLQFDFLVIRKNCFSGELSSHI